MRFRSTARPDLVVIGGPAMLIGLGGGAASSMASGQSSSDLDFASVQRDNAEMQRRCQEVIDACVAMGDANPIRRIHDVGAGGLSNALPELAKDAARGGRFEMRRVPSADPGLAPHEIWCNEAQERYVLAVALDDLRRVRADLSAGTVSVFDRRSTPRVEPTPGRRRRTRSTTARSICRWTCCSRKVPKLQRAFARRTDDRRRHCNSATFDSRMRSTGCCVFRRSVRSSS